MEFILLPVVLHDFKTPINVKTLYQGSINLTAFMHFRTSCNDGIRFRGHGPADVSSRTPSRAARTAAASPSASRVHPLSPASPPPGGSPAAEASPTHTHTFQFVIYWESCRVSNRFNITGKVGQSPRDYESLYHSHTRVYLTLVKSLHHCQFRSFR